MDQDAAFGLLELGELTPAELGALPVGLDEALHERPQRVAVALLVAGAFATGSTALRAVAVIFAVLVAVVVLVIVFVLAVVYIVISAKMRPGRVEIVEPDRYAAPAQKDGPAD